MTTKQKMVYALIQKHFKDRYMADVQRLNERLAMRENGLCVVGFALSEKTGSAANNDKQMTVDH